MAECPCLPCSTMAPLSPGNECGTGHLMEADNQPQTPSARMCLLLSLLIANAVSFRKKTETLPGMQTEGGYCGEPIMK